jgi:hypothetical protein
MNGPRASMWSMACVAVVIVAVGSALVGCSDLFCDDPELNRIEDGSYQEVPSTDPPPMPPLRDVSATIEGAELTVQYVQDTDGRTYVVRLRERE